MRLLGLLVAALLVAGVRADDKDEGEYNGEGILTRFYYRLYFNFLVSSPNAFGDVV